MDILLKQNPAEARIGAIEKKYIDLSVNSAMDILMKLTDEQFFENLASLGVLLNPSYVYFAGSNNAWNHHSPGCKKVRQDLLNKFKLHDGFQRIFDAFDKETSSGQNIIWMYGGAEFIKAILHSLNEAAIDDGNFQNEFVQKILALIMSLTEEQLKKDGVSESLRVIFQFLKKVCVNDINMFYKFWMDHTSKIMKSGTIVLKLFAWDQMQELIKEAQDTQPHISSIMVNGAGTSFVNGIYEKVGFNPKDARSLMYVKKPVDESDQEITLFRCKMKNHAYIWFISIAERADPGTDKDIDYYQQKSSAPEYARNPPLIDWEVAAKNLGGHPCPELKALGYVLEEGCTEEMTLMSRIIKMSTDRQLVQQVFGSSIHRAIVSSSKVLLLFLTKNSAITVDDIGIIWKSGLSCDADTADEVLTILASIAMEASKDLFASIIDLVSSSLKNETKDPAGILLKVASFVEKFHPMSLKPIHDMKTLVKLVWLVYTDLNFSTLKNADVIMQVLVACFSDPSGNTVALEHISKCEKELQEWYAANYADEKAISRTVQLLEFLLSLRFDGTAMEVLQNGMRLADTVICEIRRFLTLNRSRCLSAHDKEWYSNQLSMRLKVIRLFYGTSTQIHIPFDSLITLWKLFQSHNSELEQYYKFLVHGMDHNCYGKMIDLMISRNEQQEVLLTILCSEEVDWASCGPEAYQCFNTYFTAYDVANLSATDHSFDQITKTLWNIFKNIPDEVSSREAGHLILKAYKVEDNDSDSRACELLSIILQILADTEKSLIATDKLSAEQSILVSRCVELLSSAITCNKSSSSCSHASRGIMGRITLQIHHKKNQVSNYATNRISTYQFYPRATEGVLGLEVHPMHTVLQLKTTIAALLQWEDSSKIYFRDMDLKNAADSCPLQYFACIFDGAEVECNYNNPQLAYVRNNVYPSDDHQMETPSKPTIGDEISSDSAHFKSLLSFCDAVADPALSKNIWNLLMLIPTPKFCEVEVQQASTRAQWATLLDCSASASVAFNLQIIDHILQPAPEVVNEEAIVASMVFLESFISTGGYSFILQVLMKFSANETLPRKVAIYVALHILRCLLSHILNPEKVVSAAASALMKELNQHSVVLVEKLLAVASDAAAEQESGVVQDALSTINDLIQDPAVALQLIQNSQAHDLLTTVLRSESKKVRDLSSVFAVQLGIRQPDVFSWLLSDLESIDPLLSDETFYALNKLLEFFCSDKSSMTHTADLESLAQRLSEKIVSYSASLPQPSEMNALRGYMEMLDTLVAHKPQFILKTQLGKNFVKYFFNDYLFTMPSQDGKRDPVCESPELRKVALNVIRSFLVCSSEAFENILKEVDGITVAASHHTRNNWLLTLTNETKKPDIGFTGLKNQGCTCYMNSTLQQLFMSKNFREAVLSAPLKESHRGSILHRSDQELVGMNVLFAAVAHTPKGIAKDMAREQMTPVKIIDFDPVTKKHTLRFIGGPNHGDAFDVVLRSKDLRVRLPADEDDSISPAQDAAIRVLEQLQRTFCYMQYSKQRYFDPFLLVEACKTLDLNYNVFQQNDAAELFDKLIDRIEMVTKLKLNGDKFSTWENVFERNVFGGRVLYQKIPLECDKYATNKRECGHWQGARTDVFLKIELQISTKDKIYDSLSDVFIAELMDGDNKISCDVCQEKKSTIRRSSLGVMPNTMVLHLKRFDLDYTTFETVKLNSRLEFPTRINMLKYTKEGIEAEERRKEREEAESETPSSPASPHRRSQGGLAYEEPEVKEPDPEDYEYELQGALIHAGVAGGGHYFSFARDPDATDRWYRLDDDEVSQFNFSPETIAYHCFGGIHHKENGQEETRTANALMLFYSKVRTADNAPVASNTDASSSMSMEENVATPCSNVQLVTGYEAFIREVMDSNNEHTLARYLNDVDLHSFVRLVVEGLVRTEALHPGTESMKSLTLNQDETKLYRWAPCNVPDDLPLRTIQFGCRFFLSIVLHCRERCEREWLNCLKEAFAVIPRSAIWFISHLVETHNTLLDDYLIKCHDIRAKNSFINLVVSAAQVATPAKSGADCLIPHLGLPQLVTKIPEGLSAEKLMAIFVKVIHARIFRVPEYARVSDELFILLAQLAAITPIRKALVELRTLSALTFFFLHEMDLNNPIPPSIFSRFSEHKERQKKGVMVDYELVATSIYEAVAAILDVPQPRRHSLLAERMSASDCNELTHECKQAYHTIFEELTNGKNRMNEVDFFKYLEKVWGQKLNMPHIRVQYFERYSTHDTTLNCLMIHLQGFLSYQVDRIFHHGEKSSWNELYSCGFRNDLTRASSNDSFSADEPAVTSAIQIPAECIKCLRDHNVYAFALDYQSMTHRLPMVRGILHKLCVNNMEFSSLLIAQVGTK